MKNNSIGLNRNTIDKYYTKQHITQLCFDYINNNLKIQKTDLIIEPSAGNGSFINIIKKLSDNYIFYDIEPENDEIIKQDFLETNIEEYLNKYSKIHIIGNPPFGRQSSLAIKFIKKSCEFCDSISFILPKSFKKESLKKRFPLNFHLLFEIDLEDNSFLVNNVEHTVPCIFQIWEKKDFDREIIEKSEPKNYIFVKKDEHPDISFRRVGVYAGEIDKNIDEKSHQSHYFIKFKNDSSIDELINKLKDINFDHNNTVGPRSISKQELIKEFNKFI